MSVEFVVGIAGAILGAVGWLYQSYRSLQTLREEHAAMMEFVGNVNKNLKALWQEGRETREFYKWVVRQVAMAKRVKQAKQAGSGNPSGLVAKVGNHKYSGNSIRELLAKVRGYNDVMLSGDFTLPRTLIAKAKQAGDEDA